MIKLKTYLNHKGLLLKPGATVALPPEAEAKLIEGGVAEAYPTTVKKATPELSAEVSDEATTEEAAKAVKRGGSNELQRPDCL